MTTGRTLHRRRSVRLRGHDYASSATYIVTICTHERSPLFGTLLEDGQVQLNEAGLVVSRCWRAIPAHFPRVSLDAWAVMPEHVHGIVSMIGRGDACVAPTATTVLTIASRGPGAGSLAVIVGSFKSAVGRVWQRGYYEQIIHDANGLNRARDYIGGQGNYQVRREANRP